MSEPVHCKNGDFFIVREDTEEAGVMIDKYLMKRKPDELDALVMAMTGKADGVADADDSDDYLIVPADAVIALGQALIEIGNRMADAWATQSEDQDE